MKYLLDTNHCIYIIKRKYLSILETLLKHNIGEVGVSSITVAELYAGVEKSQAKAKNRDALDAFLTPLEIVDFDAEDARSYGLIKATLEKAGTPIGAYDMLIAAQALTKKMTLVTHDQDFQKIKGLNTEDWVKK